jgi:cell wall-associated NlpC family hydrolase
LYLVYPLHIEVTATRDGLKQAALWTVDSGKSITYTKGSSRWSGIKEYVLPHENVPPCADCSSFVTWLYWSAFGFYPDYLNDENWAAGYTGTMAKNGKAVSLSEAQPGDVVIYGPGPYNHAAIYVGESKVVSFGSTGPAKLLKINYRSDYHIRSYPEFFKL